MICYIKSKFIHLRFTYIYRILKIIAVGYKEHNACEGAAFEECEQNTAILYLNIIGP